MKGQVAWYDLRVSVSKASPAEADETWLRFETLASPPGVVAPSGVLSHGREFKSGRG